jgi:hypothetical protein
MRRWIKVSVAAAGVLGLGGWIAAPYAQDWWLARSVCDGGLPGDAVRRITPDGVHLTHEESARSEQLGDYRCFLTYESDDGDEEQLLHLQAYTRRDDQDRRFYASFPESGFSEQTPMADGLPGFIDQYGYLQLLLRCPDLGKDAEGRQRTLLVRGWFAREADRYRPAVYETVVAFANSASTRVGCGAEPLKVPEGELGPVQVEDDPKTVPLAEAGDTACGWLTKAGLPRPAEWRLASLLNDAAPAGRCDLYTQDSGDWRKRLVFVAWYGDWSNRLTVDDDGVRRSLTASARCGGEAANFAVDGDGELPGVGRAEQLELLEAFARNQAQRRGCSDLRLAD